MDGPNGCNVLSPLARALLGRDVKFRICCDEHDLFYDQGGDRRDRAYADKLLRECIAREGHPVWAWACWAGVRCFGWWFWRA